MRELRSLKIANVQQAKVVIMQLLFLGYWTDFQIDLTGECCKGHILIGLDSKSFADFLYHKKTDKVRSFHYEEITMEELTR